MKSFILIGISLGCGLVAAVGASRYLGDKQSSAAEAVTVKIAVAKKEVNINEALTGESFELQDWPKSKVPKGAIEDPKKLADTHAKTRFYPGEPILASRILGPGEGARQLAVPMGYRVVSVKVNQESSVSNLVQPGDRVDVVVVIRNANDRSISKTILRAVRVFAVNSETDRATEQSKTPGEVRTASLLVTPSQAEKLLMGADLGQLRLALRSPDDTTVDETKGCNYDELLGRGETADNTLAKTVSGAKESPPGQPRWTMWVCSPAYTTAFPCGDSAAKPAWELPLNAAKKKTPEPTDTEITQAANPDLPQDSEE